MPAVGDSVATGGGAGAGAALELSRSLPVDFSKSVADENPSFATLMRELFSTHLTADCVSVSVAKEEAEARTQLANKRQDFLQCHAVYTEVKDLLLEGGGGSGLPEGIEMKARRLFEAAEAAQFCNVSKDHCAPEDQTLLFGVDHDAIVDVLMDRATLSRDVVAVQHALIPEVEERLRRKCERIAEFFDPQGTESAFQYAKSTQLGELIQQVTANLEYEKGRLVELRDKTESDVVEHYKVMAKMVETLADVLTDQKLEKHFGYADVETEWMRTRYKTMALKLSVLKSQFLRDTYTKRTVAALRIIRSNLDNTRDELEGELADARKRIAEYRSIGSSFDALAREYAQLLKEIQHKEWTLQELQRGN